MNSYSKKFLALVLLAGLVVPAVASAQFCQVGDRVWVPCPFEFAPGPAGENTFGGLVLYIIDLLLLVVGALSVLFLIIGGFRYVTAEGSEERIESAKKTMWHSIVGIVIVIMSFAVIAIITNFLIGGIV